MADGPRISEDDVIQVFRNLSPEARERIVNALAKYLVERKVERSELDRLRKLK